MRHRLPKCPAETPCFGALELRWQVAGPPDPGPHPVLQVSATARSYEVGFVTAEAILGSPFPPPAARATIPALSFGTWRSPVAHCNGVAGVAGSNPAVPIQGITAPGRSLRFSIGDASVPLAHYSPHRLPDSLRRPIRPRIGSGQIRLQSFPAGRHRSDDQNPVGSSVPGPRAG